VQLFYLPDGLPPPFLTKPGAGFFLVILGTLFLLCFSFLVGLKSFSALQQAYSSHPLFSFFPFAHRVHGSGQPSVFFYFGKDIFFCSCDPPYCAEIRQRWQLFFPAFAFHPFPFHFGSSIVGYPLPALWHPVFFFFCGFFLVFFVFPVFG